IEKLYLPLLQPLSVIPDDSKESSVVESLPDCVVQSQTERRESSVHEDSVSSPVVESVSPPIVDIEPRRNDSIPSQSPGESHYVTRYGRVVRPPKRLTYLALSACDDPVTCSG